MAKRSQKVSVNLTEEEYEVLKALAKLERRSISELAALIIVDTSLAMFRDKQEKGKMEIAHFHYGKFNI